MVSFYAVSVQFSVLVSCLVIVNHKIAWYRELLALHWISAHILHSLVPRLFLVEERAWQHWGVRAVYFRYVMINMIYSDHALFL